jgi:hypothetical protein
MDSGKKTSFLNQNTKMKRKKPIERVSGVLSPIPNDDFTPTVLIQTGNWKVNKQRYQYSKKMG